MALNFRMLPPPAVISQTIVVKGRSYSGAPGSVMDILDADAMVLSANGWIRVAASGTTAQRPTTNMYTNPPYIAAPGVTYWDVTLSKLIVFDGLTWRDPNNGDAV